MKEFARILLNCVYLLAVVVFIFFLLPQTYSQSLSWTDHFPASAMFHEVFLRIKQYLSKLSSSKSKILKLFSPSSCTSLIWLWYAPCWRPFFRMACTHHRRFLLFLLPLFIWMYLHTLQWLSLAPKIKEDDRIWTGWPCCSVARQRRKRYVLGYLGTFVDTFCFNFRCILDAWRWKHILGFILFSLQLDFLPLFKVTLYDAHHIRNDNFFTYLVGLLALFRVFPGHVFLSHIKDWTIWNEIRNLSSFTTAWAIKCLPREVCDRFNSFKCVSFCQRNMWSMNIFHVWQWSLKEGFTVYLYPTSILYTPLPSSILAPSISIPTLYPLPDTPPSMHSRDVICYVVVRETGDIYIRFSLNPLQL